MELHLDRRLSEQRVWPAIEISKSGTPILPSKRARKIPEKTQVFSKEDIAQSAPTQPTEQAEPSGETEDASVEDLKDQEIKEPSENANQD